jgi:hypothetical protein
MSRMRTRSASVSALPRGDDPFVTEPRRVLVPEEPVRVEHVDRVRVLSANVVHQRERDRQHARTLDVVDLLYREVSDAALPERVESGDALEQVVHREAWARS